MNFIKKLYSFDGITNQIKSDILDVYSSIRPSARILFYYNQNIKDFLEFITSNEIKISVSKGYILQKKNNGNYVDYFANQNLKEKPELEKLFALYISLDENLANDCRTKDESKDDNLFGIALGYPKCCVSFVEKKGKPPTVVESFIKDQVNNMYNPYTWLPSMINDSNLITHFPCSLNCKASEKMAIKRWQIIKKETSNETVNHFQLNLSTNYQLTKEKKIISGHGINKSLPFVSPIFSI